MSIVYNDLLKKKYEICDVNKKQFEKIYSVNENNLRSRTYVWNSSVKE